MRCLSAQGTSSHAPPRQQLPISVPGLPQRSGREAKGRLSLSDSPQAILIGPCCAGFPPPVPLPTLPTTPFPRPTARHSRPCHPSSSSQLTVLAGDLVTGQQQMPTAKTCTLGPLGRREHSRSERRCEVRCVRSGTAVSTASAADPAKEEIRAGLEGSACGDGREQLGMHGKQLSIV